jgi:hypothetical protein
MTIDFHWRLPTHGCHSSIHRGNYDRGAYNRGEAAPQTTLVWLYVGIAVLVIGGVAIFVYGR